MERENYGKWNSFLWGPMNAQFWIHAVSQILKLNIVHLLYSIRDNISQCEISWWLCVFSCVFCFLFFFLPWILLSLCFFHCLRAGKAAFKKLGKKKKKVKHSRWHNDEACSDVKAPYGKAGWFPDPGLTLLPDDSILQAGALAPVARRSPNCSHPSSAIWYHFCLI